MLQKFIALFIALLTAFVVGQITAQSPIAPLPFRQEDPPDRGLDANLFMQTSAEFHACCLQAYNLASLRLKQALAKNPEGKLAVILDLDETVIDNGGFQAMQLRSNLAFDLRLWDDWERNGGNYLSLLPGVKQFLNELSQNHVSAAYISNRNEKNRDVTKKALARLGIEISDDRLLQLATDTSDKTQRRELIAKDFNVLLVIGDNLRDFDECFRCRKLESKTPEELDQAIRERKEAVEKHRQMWGDRWIIIPNPVYGEWTKPLGLGRKDLDRLAPVAKP